MTRAEFDDLDRNIMRVLQVDGWMRFKQVDDRVNVPDGTGLRRVQELLDEGVM